MPSSKARWAMPQARGIAESAGLDYVEDRCLIVERAAAGLTRLG